MNQGVTKFVLLAYMVTLALTCDLVYRPDCTVLPPGSLHPHEASCSHFYRCDEFHNAVAYTCPPGKRFLHQGGDLCAHEARVTCDRCPLAASRCGDCSCSPTTPPPCLTTTPGPCTVEPTTESPTSWLPSSSTTSTGVSFTTERITQPTTERYTPHQCPPIPSCVGSSSGTLRPYPPDCSKFLYCDDYDVAKLVSCNIGQHFSPTQLQCMPINEANCPICVPDYTIPDMTTVTYYPLPDCPPIPDCLYQPPGSVLPYPPDCSKYVYCLSGFFPDISSCPPGHHFSPEYLTCLLPEIADCPQCVTNTTTTPAPTTNLPDCAPVPSCDDAEPGIKLPFPQDCGMYIYCESPTNFSFVLCTAGEYFSPTLHQCTLPEIAGCPLCNPGVTPYPTPTPVCPPTPDCSDSKPGDLQPYPSDCSLFIECFNSSEYILSSCQDGQHFSPYHLVCEPIEQADCPSCIITDTTTTEITVTTTPSTSTTVISDCDPIPSCLDEVPGSKLPFPIDCEMYIYCDSQTESSLVLCVAGEHFSPTLRECASQETAGCPICNPGVTPYPTPTPVCPPTPNCSDSNPGDVKPYPTDCNLFIQCISSDEESLISCPVGQHFSPYHLICELIEQADCPPCITTDTTTTFTSTEVTVTMTPSTSTTVLPDCDPIPSCLNEKPGSKLPFPLDCEMYIYCESQTESILVLCAAGEHFSPMLRECAPQETAGCPICYPGVSPYPTPSPVCPPTPDCSDSKPGDLVPYPPDCSLFIECSNSSGYILSSCPEGQHFSPYHLVCEPIEQSDCPSCIITDTTTTFTTTEVTVTTTPSTSTTVLPDCDPTPSCLNAIPGSKLPFPLECEMYIYCESQTESSLVLCAAGEHFSPTLRECAPKEIAGCPICNPGVTPYPTPTPECPPTPDCSDSKPGDLHPYPPVCSLFIECSNSSEYILSSCPDGQHFSPYHLACEPIEQADCPSCIITDTTTTEVTATTTPSTSTTVLPDCDPIPNCLDAGPGSKLPFPSDCEMYIYCESQTDSNLVLCAAGEHFSPTLRECAPQETAGCPICNPGVTPYPTPTPECPPTPDCSNSKPGDLHPFPPDCSLFIECSNSSEYILSSCPDGQHFSPYHLVCEPIQQADCPSCIITDTTTIFTTTEVTVTTTPSTSTTVLPDCDPIPNCEDAEPGSKLPFPLDCEMYIYCESQTDPSLVLCAAGEHFSPSLRECAPQETAGCPICNPGVTPYPTPTPVCPPTPNCSDSNPGDVKPYPTDCNLFIQCISSDEEALISCPVGQHFSPYHLICEPIEQADCPSCITTDTTTTFTTTEVTVTMTPSTSTTILPDCDPIPSCLDAGPGSKLPFPLDCEMYIYCESQTDSSLVLCAAGKHFSPTLRECASQEIAGCPLCNPGVTPYPTPTPVCPPTPDCSDSKPGDLQPYPPDCSLFIECSNNSEFVLSSCPDGQHFSPYHLVCEPIKQADCPSCIITDTTTTEVTVTMTPSTSTTVLPDCDPIPSCLDEGSGSKLPFPLDCEMYIYCESQTDPSLVLCAAGEHFSPTLRQCASQEIAGCPLCNPGVTPYPTPTPVCPPSPNCTNSHPGDVKPYPPDCTLFIECSNSSEYILSSCPDGQHFSPYHLVCEPIEQADCPSCVDAVTTTTSTSTESTTTTDATTITDATSTTEESTTVPPTTTIEPPICPLPRICNVQPILIQVPPKEPYPPDCSKYQYCYDRKEPYIGSCPSGLHFSPTVLECMDPELANCVNCVEPTQ